MNYQTKKNYEKTKDKKLQEQKDKSIHFKEIVRIYVEVENRFKKLEEKVVSFHPTKKLYVRSEECRPRLHVFLTCLFHIELLKSPLQLSH